MSTNRTDQGEQFKFWFQPLRTALRKLYEFFMDISVDFPDNNVIVVIEQVELQERGGRGRVYEYPKIYAEIHAGRGAMRETGL
ncbi:MAG: hypothetical protein NC091_06220 [Bacteroides sp.]|nr:hypothetical protein [Bacteroides sp.]